MQGGAQVSLFSRHGTAAWFCTFDGASETRTALKKKGDVFSALVPGVKAGDHYGFRVAGPWEPTDGHLFDESKLLADPFATRFSAPFAYDARLSQPRADTAALVPKAIVEAALPDVPQRKPKPPRFIYELGVKSFTKLHPEVPDAQRGTVAALAHPAIIAHLKHIGVDTVELMPLHVWMDERHLQPLGLTNAWGYNSVQFFALDPRLCPGGWAELRGAVAALHAAGLQVLLDVVFNHSGESDVHGPALSFRGLDNAVYYAQDNGVLHNDAGTGNTLALNNPPVTAMVLAALRHAVMKAGIDGFRFDLATALGRMGDEGFRADAPLIEAITNDPILGARILIAEPWDVGPGGYRLGNFPSGWLEWNDQFRDGVRRFWRGDYWSANQLATRLCGSSDVFATRKPSASVNFLAAHDGFTLRDLTLFAEKRNHDNGEGNRDGNNAEVTCPASNVQALLATLFLSRGTMMLTAGDEFGRTQNGNNNAYCQDNETTWLDWSRRDQKLIDYVSNLNALRARLESFLEDQFVTADEAEWFGPAGGAMPWNARENFVLGLLLTNAAEARLALMFNAGDDAAPLPLKAGPGKNWQRIFASSDGQGCPPHSVAVFELKSARKK
ncbi:MAG: glycogen debranching enzyme [Alphaproteobacteria bacterium]|nr:glycogen debranching enzyme [Alphaproteobacteria bacterium]